MDGPKATDQNPDSATDLPFRLWLSVIIITLSSLEIGWAIEQLNAVTGDPSEPGALVLNTFEISMATTMLYVTSMPTALMAKTPMESMGRRACLLYADVFYLLGGLLTACAARNPPNVLYMGRALMGVGVGASLSVVPTLLSEIAPPAHRGRIGFLHTVMMTLGLLLCSVLSYFFVDGKLPGGWRMANGAFMVPALVQLLMQRFVPESPRWLVRHGRAADAELTLRRLYGKEGTGEVPIDVRGPWCDKLLLASGLSLACADSAAELDDAEGGGGTNGGGGGTGGDDADIAAGGTAAAADADDGDCFDDVASMSTFGHGGHCNEPSAANGRGSRDGGAADHDGRSARGDGGAVKKPEAAVSVYWELLTKHRRSFLVTSALALIQPFGGVNVVTSYSTYIFHIAGVHRAVEATCVCVAVCAVSSVLAMPLVDRVGRRVLLVTSALIMAASAALVSLAFLRDAKNATATDDPVFDDAIYTSADDAASATDAAPAADNDWVTSAMAILGVSTFYGGYAIGTGPVLWIYISESFPDRHRAAALGLLSLFNCTSNLVTVYSALYLINALAGCPLKAQVDDDSLCSPDAHATGASWLFAILAASSGLTCLFILAFVNETAGVPLDSLERDDSGEGCAAHPCPGGGTLCGGGLGLGLGAAQGGAAHGDCRPEDGPREPLDGRPTRRDDGGGGGGGVAGGAAAGNPLHHRQTRAEVEQPLLS